MKSFKCHFCDFCHSQFPKFERHLSSVHQLDDIVQVYVDLFCGGQHPTCMCGCGAVPKWNGWQTGFSKVVRGHNARNDSVWLSAERQAEFAAKRKDGHKSGRLKAWNAGLTASTSETIRESSEKASETLRRKYSAGELISWQQGATKDTNDSVKKMSQTLQSKFESGEIAPWNAGLTKETSVTIAQSASKISAKMQGRHRLTADEIISRIEAGGFELACDISDYKTRRVNRLAVKCSTCGNISSKSVAMIQDTPTCFFCHPRESKGQLEVFEFVKQMSSDAVIGDRSVIAPLELDVYVPSRKFGVEFNELYWHSEAHKNADYHVAKLNACRQAGVSLFNVFSDEWRDKRQICESMIAHRLGHASRVIGARKCELIQLDPSDRKHFFERNHIDGDVAASIAFGLKYNDVLVSAMSLRRPFHEKYSDRFEVARFCSVLQASVPGALAKLTKRCLTHARSAKKLGLVTYTDDRVGEGMSWQYAGWRLAGATPARFWWTDGYSRINRFAIRADSQRQLTEQEVAREAGVYRIYGCGNKVLQIA